MPRPTRAACPVSKYIYFRALPENVALRMMVRGLARRPSRSIWSVTPKAALAASVPAMD